MYITRKSDRILPLPDLEIIKVDVKDVAHL